MELSGILKHCDQTLLAQTATWEQIKAIVDDGIRYETLSQNQILCEKLTVENETASSKLGKSIGTYYTVHSGDIRLLDRASYDDCRISCKKMLSDAIHCLLTTESVSDSVYNNSPASSAGEEAERRHAVSPEWDQGHIDVKCGTIQTDNTEEQPEVSPDIPIINDSDTLSDCIDTIADVPPAPMPERQTQDINSVLVVGLGNPELTPDALGPMCVRQLSVTRHLKEDASSLPEDFRGTLPSLSAFCPMVIGQTGIETLALVHGAVDAAKPQLVILIDALASSEISHLVRTVQISTTGIHPGGGIGNRRQPLTKETLGVPVLTIGVPTVISSSTMVYRALEGAGLLPMDGTDPALREALRETLSASGSSYVAPKDIDLSVREFSRLLAQVINETVLGEEISSEWFQRI